MINIDQKICDALDIAPPDEQPSTTEVAVVPSNFVSEQKQAHKAIINIEDIASDFQTARDTLRKLSAQGLDAIEAALDLAKRSQDPEMFTAFSQVLKAANETNRDLFGVVEKAVEMQTTIDTQQQTEEIEQQAVQQQNIQQNIFVGTTADIVSQIIERTNKRAIETVIFDDAKYEVVENDGDSE